MNKEAEDIKIIREMMEKSSKFLSFNGISIVFAGIFAIVGAIFAYFIMSDVFGNKFSVTQKMMVMLGDALIVLFLSVCSVTFFCWKKARANHVTLFSSTTRRAAYSLLLPLFTGGIFSLVFLFKGDVHSVYAATMIFYGLALVNTSKFTFREVSHLGLSCLAFGIAALFLTEISLYLWAGCFGLCHIIIGFIMYFKYEKTGNIK